ncbi:MAG: hypothetical protein R3240_00005, partial [Gammaproteobacteria bacterium]|nr:hypothetical protein [Gammaproteobacteria bacterium]
MKINDFSGGINTRLAAQSIAANQAADSYNVENTRGLLEPVNKKTALNLAMADYFTYYKYKQKWVSSPLARDYIEYRNTLYFTDAPAPIVSDPPAVPS